MFLIDRVQNKAISLERKTFHELNFEERKHLQEWIVDNPEMLGEPLLIIQKEFPDWSDTNERLDLLALDRQGNLVIIENKLDDSGRDVVWQALKYVSYCAALSKSEICEIYQRYLGTSGNAQESIAEFFETAYENVTLNPTNGDQRMILVAANFKKEVTSTVLWLIEHDIDIACVEVVPFQQGDNTFLQTARILPIREAVEYQVKLNSKKQEETAQKLQTNARAILNQEFWAEALPALRTALPIFQKISPSKNHWLNGASGHSGITFVTCIFEKNARVELYIDSGSKDKNKEIFARLQADKESLEASFGAPLDWQELPDKNASRIAYQSESGGINDRENWSVPIDFLATHIAKLYDVLKPALDKIMK